jgi:hypothetical protein
MQAEGKICCPKCFARLGTWCWAGVMFNDRLVKPSFKITRSKVEFRCEKKYDDNLCVCARLRVSADGYGAGRE